MFETSQSTAGLDAALAKAQGEIEAASKDKVNPAFRSKYADLTAVWAAIRPALAKHGISVTQWPVHSDDGRLHMITRLAHGGEWLRGHFSIPVTKQDAHGYGSATTYAKRFSLAAAVGVVADDDDDGNAASKASETRQTAPPANGTASKAASRVAYDRLVTEMRTMQSAELLRDWLKLRRVEIEKMPTDWQITISHEYEDHKEGLLAKVSKTDPFGPEPIGTRQ
jgi:hypothetical protein